MRVSTAEYERLRRRDERAFAAEELSEAELDAIARAEVPAEHGPLDDELKDWRP